MRGTRNSLNYADMLEDPIVKDWYDNVARGSRTTADVYIRRLRLFRDENKISLKALLEMKPVEIQKMLDRYINRLLEEDKKPTYVHSHLKAVKSFLNHNDVVITKRFPIPGSHDEHDETPPSLPELRQIILAGNIRSRVAIAFMAFSGVRPQVLGKQDGTDGLMLSDIPELEIEGQRVVFTKMPIMVVVRKKLSKTRKAYRTFLSEEGAEYLRVYLEYRMKKGENLTSDSPVILPYWRTDKKKEEGRLFCNTGNISEMIKKAMKKASYHGRPYVFRTFFATNLMLAQRRGYIIESYRSHWMGHSGNVGCIYTTNRRLSGDVIEDMRVAYKKSEEFFSTQRSEESEDKVRMMIQRELLKGRIVFHLKNAGVPDEKVAAIIKQHNLLDKPESEVESLLNEEYPLNAQPATNPIAISPGACPGCAGSCVQSNKEGVKVLCPVCNGRGRWTPPE